MKDTALTRLELSNVIEGKGHARRVPILFHCWIHPESFPPETSKAVSDLLSQYPMDAQMIPFNIPQVYNAPTSDLSYRWSYRDSNKVGQALDNDGVIEDWDEELDLLLNDFPSPEYADLIPVSPPDDGRYRLGHWWYFFFERFWSIRGMENALTDFYLNPDAVHAVFRKLTEFYKRMLTRGKEELHLDGVFTSDDLGTQSSTFFNPSIFEEFFMPYYKQVIDHAHALGMHFWLHSCGNIEGIIPQLTELGLDVLHPIQKFTMDEARIAGLYGDKIAIWAGFDVQNTIPFGTPEDVRREVRFIIDTYQRKDGRFLFTLGNGATTDTPLASLEALFDEAIQYGNFCKNNEKNR